MPKFSDDWNQQQKEGVGRRAKKVLEGPKPIRPQLQKATKELRQEINKLDSSAARLKQREETIFKKTVGAVQSHNEQTGKAYANELVEVRKMQKMVTSSKVSLEQVSTRLETVTEIGDFAATLGPVVGVVRNLRNSLAGSMPDAQNALGEAGEVLNSMLSDVGQLTGIGFFLGETSEEAEKVLSEATVVAENRMSKDLSEIPG